MVVVPLGKSTHNSEPLPRTSQDERTNWARIAAGGTLLAGGLLLLTGRRRAGLLTAAAGTTLALLDQNETMRSVWQSLPGYIDNVQSVLTKVQSTVEDVAQKREKLRRILAPRG
jgi:LPXTG-motif cell wall-anchored protein